MRLLAIGLLATTSACATAAGTILVPHLIMTSIPAGEIGGGNGEVSRAAHDRLEHDEKAAQLAITRGALEAAEQHPGDLRLQRRAAALVRANHEHLGHVAAPSHQHRTRKVAADPEPLDHAAIEPLLARLAATPCPGLADVAATRLAFGDNARAGAAYVQAARTCGDVEAAVAAVAPLRAVDRCDDAIATLRALWPQVDRKKRGATVPVLDAVRACSDDLNLRANLAFVPDDVVEDYFAVLDARARRAIADAARADAEYRREQAEQRSRDVTSRCESECGAAESSCEASCTGDASCMQRCSSVLHVCRSGCGAP